MAASRPVEDVLTDPDTDPAVRKRLAELPAILRFARRELGLDAGDSYRTYAALGREALVWSVVAAPVDSLQPHSWCYPVVGCANYRGYFRQPAALAYAMGLAGQGWDVAVEPVPAYSTLGWFSDPLPSTVVRWPLPDMVALLFHELAHQTLYLSGDSAFNEAYATVVEQEGLRRWLVRHGTSQQRLDQLRQALRRDDFLRLLAVTRERLRVLYATGVGRDDLVSHKAAIFAALRAEYAVLRESWGGYAGYDHWFDRPLNNAHLASVGTYHALEPALQIVLQQTGGDMTAFHAACRALATLEPERRNSYLDGLPGMLAAR